MCQKRLAKGCCSTAPTGMDIYGDTRFYLRSSSTRNFTRNCFNNTLTRPENGAAVEAFWSTPHDSAEPRTGHDRHRAVVQSNACWGSSAVYQIELCQPLCNDIFDTTATVYKDLVHPDGGSVPPYWVPDLPDTITVETMPNDGVQHPVTDPTGEGWALLPTSLSGRKVAVMNLDRSDYTFHQYEGIGAVRVSDTSNFVGIEIVADIFLNVTTTLYTVTLDVRTDRYTNTIVNGNTFCTVVCDGSTISLWEAAERAVGDPTFTIDWPQGQDSTLLGFVSPPAGFSCQSPTPKFFLSQYDDGVPIHVAQFEDIAYGYGGYDDIEPLAVSRPGWLYSGFGQGLGQGDIAYWCQTPMVMWRGPTPDPIGAPGTTNNPVHKIEGGARTIINNADWEYVTIPNVVDTRSITITKMGLGIYGAATFPRHACNLAAGILIESVASQVTYKLYIQDIDWTIGSEQRKITGGMLIDTWQESNPYTLTADDNLNRLNIRPFGQIYLDFGSFRPLLLGSYGVNGVDFFEATPDLSAWVLVTNGMFTSVNGPRMYVGFGSTIFSLTDLGITSFTGAAVTAGSSGTLKPAVGLIDQNFTFQIITEDGIIYSQYLGFSFYLNVAAASDIYFYITGANLTTEQAQALSTATIPDTFAMNADLPGNGYPDWMIAVDGSIRFPAVGASREYLRHPVGAPPWAYDQYYMSREKGEGSGSVAASNALDAVDGRGGGLGVYDDMRAGGFQVKVDRIDCIKDHLLPYAPSLFNPAY